MTDFSIADPYKYHHGFSSHFESEALPNSLPTRNSPQKPPYGLYAEKLSGSAFTAPRQSNKQTWMYRILPSASHISFESAESNTLHSSFTPIPNQIRWDPFEITNESTFITGLHLLAGAGNVESKNGIGIYVYSCGKSMSVTEAFYNSDGDFLVVPQTGDLDVRTELGCVYVRPNEILIIPRGFRFTVSLPAGPARGYILETYTAAHFELPELGPIGSDGLANPRDFRVPRAAYIDSQEAHTVVTKFAGNLYSASQNHSPFDVVGWHGNYYPMKYDLGRFNTIGTISFDHPDPSIFTVLTVPSALPGTAIADFVIFPPRWLVGEDTFRPPWYHRNCMSEFMGLIDGGYDAKTGGGFRPGGASLHNVMAGHGPDATTAELASEESPLVPKKVGTGSMAFMFESMFMVGVTEWGLKSCRKVQSDYNTESWTGVKRRFVPPPTE